MVTPRFTDATPVLRVADYPRARAFYVDVLGFAVAEEGGTPARFGILERGRSTVFLDAHHGGPNHAGGDHGWDAYLHVRGLEAIAAALGEGPHVRGTIRTTNYDMRELDVVDPDGNCICLGEDLGPPNAIIRNHYVLAVPDLERTADFYRRVLGCSADEVDPGNWTFLRCGRVTFMAGRCADAIPASQLGDHSYFAYLVVDDVDAWHDRAAREGAELIKALRDEPWGMREFGLRTVDGHRIMLGQDLD